MLIQIGDVVSIWMTFVYLNPDMILFGSVCLRHRLPSFPLHHPVTLTFMFMFMLRHVK